MKTFTDYVIQNHPDPDTLQDGTMKGADRYDQLEKLAQAYADANAIEFAKWVDEQPLLVGYEQQEITWGKLLQKYREQNK